LPFDGWLVSTDDRDTSYTFVSRYLGPSCVGTAFGGRYPGLAIDRDTHGEFVGSISVRRSVSDVEVRPPI